MKLEAGYIKKLFLIDPYQRKIPTDSGTWLIYRFVIELGIMKTVSSGRTKRRQKKNKRTKKKKKKK